MKWQMRKIVLLAVIVSILFFSMLVYYVTYPFLFQNKMFLLSNFCLFQLEKHMKELSLIRIIIAGLLLLTVLIVCKRIWRQFSIVKITKVLIPFVRKETNIYIADYGSCGIYNGLFRPKVVMSEGLLQTFSDEEIDAIIFHEEYHQKNWDPLKLFCFTLLAEGMMYIPILKGLLQRYHTYQELVADKYAMQKWNLHLS